MALTVTTRKAGEVVVVNAVGRINLGAGSVTLRETLLEAAAIDKPKIVLNLSSVTHMDSSGIGELVSGFTSARNKGGALRLAALPKRIEDLLRMTAIYRIFDVYETESQAIHSFE